MQHNRNCASSGSVADEVQNPDLLQREPESVNVGTLAQRRIASAYCAAIRPESFIDTGNSGADWRNTAGTATSLQTGTDVGRARGDIALGGSRPLDPCGGQPAWTGTFHYQQGNQAKWWISRVSGESGRCTCVGSCPSPQGMQARRESGTRTGGGG